MTNDSQRCGDCTHYKGAKIQCGQRAALDSVYGFTPQGPTDGCRGQKFQAKEVAVTSLGQLLKQKLEAKPYAGTALVLKHNGSPSQLKKENTMSNAIIRLADSQLSKQIEDFGGLQLDIREALEEMQKEEQKTAALQAAKEVMSVLKQASTVIEMNVADINHARKQERLAKQKISDINKAKAYGKATNNFVPLSVLLGLVGEYQVENKDLLKIDESKLPKDWDKKGE